MNLFLEEIYLSEWGLRMTFCNAELLLKPIGARIKHFRSKSAKDDGNFAWIFHIIFTIILIEWITFYLISSQSVSLAALVYFSNSCLYTSTACNMFHRWHCRCIRSNLTIKRDMEIFRDTKWRLSRTSFALRPVRLMWILTIACGLLARYTNNSVRIIFQEKSLAFLFGICACLHFGEYLKRLHNKHLTQAT